MSPNPPTPFPKREGGEETSSPPRFGEGPGEGISTRRTWRSYALGVFILFQLIYLPTANAIKLIALRMPESRGELDDDIQLRGQAFGEPLQTVADAVGTAFVRWGELTGQAQGWSLFAPVFGHQASLPMVRFANGMNIRSEFAPTNPDSHSRLPSSSCRLFNYEYRMTLVLWTWDHHSYGENPQIWFIAVQNRVKRQQKSISTFLRWRTSAALLGGSPVYLYAELFPNPPLHDPSFERASVLPFPMARWQPVSKLEIGLSALETWESPSGRITWLPIEEPP